MKTATVTGLRDRYTAILEWIEAGEEIVITQRGKVIARLVPKLAKQKLAEVNWSESPAVKRDRSSSQMLTDDESGRIVHDAGGKW